MKRREEAARKAAALLAETPLGHGTTDLGFAVDWEGEHGGTCAYVLDEFNHGKTKLSTRQWELLEALLDAVLATNVPAVRNDTFVPTE